MSGSRAASLSHLLGRLEVVGRRVRAAVDGRRASDPDPLDRFRGLHITPAQVERLLGSAMAPPSPDGQAERTLLAVEEAADQAERYGAELRLRRLQRTFGLDDLDLELLLVSLAPDLDPRFERLYGYLHDDVSRRRPSAGLWLELLGLEPAGGTAWSRLAGSGKLLRGRLLLVEDADRPFLTRALRVPDRVTAFLLGGDEPDAAVAELLAPAGSVRLGADPPPAAAALARALKAGVRLAYLRERPGSGALALACWALQGLGGRPLAVDLQRLRSDADAPEVALLLAREARLKDRTLVAGPVEVLAGRGPGALVAFAELPASVILYGTGSWDPAWSREVPLCADVPAPEPAERAQLWHHWLDGAAGPGLDATTATAAFRLTPDQVSRAARAARVQAEAAGRSPQAADLVAGARAQNAAGLERLARRIEPAARLDDMVLPGDVLEQLRELTVRARHRDRVLDQWGMAGAASRRRGLTALFAGASGTGKTMAAEAVAAEMGLDLYVVDLASVVDKYVGETEKNLDRIFAEAERVNGVLLFDEADALFGKRSDVSDAHDRYANVEVAYLLQRMELFDGMALLATNLRSNLDEAFARRLDALIDFPDPEQEDRLLLWRRCLGELAPRDADLDLDFLAGAFRLSGGNIRNVILTAAYAAAEADRPISMADLVRGTQREYRKLGRMVVESEFGPYFSLVTTSR